MEDAEKSTYCHQNLHFVHFLLLPYEKTQAAMYLIDVGIIITRKKR